MNMDGQTEILGNAKSVEFHDINKETLPSQHPLSVIESAITINSSITKCGQNQIIVSETKALQHAMAYAATRQFKCTSAKVVEN